jgi:hypothetical protein
MMPSTVKGLQANGLRGWPAWWVVLNEGKVGRGNADLYQSRPQSHAHGIESPGGQLNQYGVTHGAAVAADAQNSHFHGFDEPGCQQCYHMQSSAPAPGPAPQQLVSTKGGCCGGYGDGQVHDKHQSPRKERIAGSGKRATRKTGAIFEQVQKVTRDRLAAEEKRLTMLKKESEEDGLELVFKEIEDAGRKKEQEKLVKEVSEKREKKGKDKEGHGMLVDV